MPFKGFAMHQVKALQTPLQPALAPRPARQALAPKHSCLAWGLGRRMGMRLGICMGMGMGLALCAGGASSAGAAASSFPPGAQAQVQTLININTTVAPSAATQSILLVSPGTATSSSLSGVSGQGHAQVDLASGILRADASTNRGFSTLADGWEFLSFSGNGNVSFAFDVDGTLSNLRPAGIVAIDASVRLYNVTSWTSYFGNTGGQQFVAKNGSGSPFPDQVGFAFDNYGVRGAAAASCASQFINTCVTSSNGLAQAVSFSLGASAPVLAGNLYLVQLQVSLYTFSAVPGTAQQTADFSHTAAFRFSNLNGLSYDSASGVFLSAVPEPQTSFLLLAGLAVLAGWARRRGCFIA